MCIILVVLSTLCGLLNYTAASTHPHDLDLDEPIPNDWLQLGLSAFETGEGSIIPQPWSNTDDENGLNEQEDIGASNADHITDQVPDENTHSSNQNRQLKSCWNQIESQSDKRRLTEMLKDAWGYAGFPNANERTQSNIKQKMTVDDVHQLLRGKDESVKQGIICRTMPYHLKPEIIQKKEYIRYLAGIGMRGGFLRKRVNDAIAESEKTNEPVWNIIRRKGAKYLHRKNSTTSA